jgi:hypothetical protein
MVLITEYDIGDIVSVGPIHDARVIGIKFYNSITYDVQYFNDNVSVIYTAYDWELKMVDKFNKDK